MKDLLITRRHGEKRDVAVISGVVDRITDDGFVLKNTVRNPVTGNAEPGRVSCRIDKEMIRRMALKEGAAIMALVDATDDMDIVFDGGWAPGMGDFSTSGRQVRYTGEFIFGADDRNSDDAVVLCGMVSDEETRAETPERFVTKYQVTYRCRGVDTRRSLIRATRKQPEPIKGRRAVFVTSPTRDDGTMAVRKVRTLS